MGRDQQHGELHRAEHPLVEKTDGRDGHCREAARSSRDNVDITGSCGVRLTLLSAACFNLSAVSSCRGVREPLA